MIIPMIKIIHCAILNIPAITSFTGVMLKHMRSSMLINLYQLCRFNMEIHLENMIFTSECQKKNNKRNKEM